MAYNTLMNTAQPAFQPGRSPATAPLQSPAVQQPAAPYGTQNPATLDPGAQAPGTMGMPQGSVAPGAPYPPSAQAMMGGFANGNPFMNQALMMSQGPQPMPQLGIGNPASPMAKAVGAFAPSPGARMGGPR